MTKKREVYQFISLLGEFESEVTAAALLRRSLSDHSADGGKSPKEKSESLRDASYGVERVRENLIMFVERIIAG